MNRCNRSPSRITLLGGAVGWAALFAGFLIRRPNRLAAGVPVQIWDSPFPWAAAVFSVFLAAIVVISITGKPGRIRSLLKAGSASVILLGTIFFLAAAARVLADPSETARVAPGAGAWLLLFSGYIVLQNSVKSIQERYIRLFFPLIILAAIAVMGATGFLNDLSLIKELIVKKNRFIQEVGNHLKIAFTSVGLAAVIGVPLGILAYRREKVEKPLFYIINTAQTIPSLALFGLLIAPLSLLSIRFPFLRTIGLRGIGAAPALIALTLYALLPVTRNTFVSLKMLEEGTVEAGRGMGMTRRQLLARVEIPLAAPILLNGIRLAAVQAIGNTAVAALIGAGGLGFFIFQGLGQAAADLILLGAIPVVVLAVFFDRFMLFLIRVLSPKMENV